MTDLYKSSFVAHNHSRMMGDMQLGNHNVAYDHLNPDASSSEGPVNSTRTTQEAATGAGDNQQHMEAYGRDSPTHEFRRIAKPDTTVVKVEKESHWKDVDTDHCMTSATDMLSPDLHMGKMPLEKQEPQSPDEVSTQSSARAASLSASSSEAFSSPLPALASLARNPSTTASFHSSLVSASNSDPETDGCESHSYRRSSDMSDQYRDSSSPDHRMGGLRGDLYYCHLCTYIGMTKEEFDDHMGTHFEHQCPFCDYTSRTEGRLKRHIKDFHNDGNDPYIDNGRRDQGKSKIMRCRQCNFSSEDKYEFWSHQRGHIKDDKMLQCPKCPFVTEYKHHLEYHLRNHFGSKPYKCGKCNYACVNKSMLNSHMKSHTNVYQYRCADCTYATKYCHSLKLHLKKYAHKPATVLNADGSLPTDGSGDFDLVSKRGPPRGPRGPRKDKSPSPDFVPSGPSMPSPHTPFGNGLLTTPPAFWPLLPGQSPLGTLPTPPPVSFPAPPPLIPVSAINQLSLGLHPQTSQLFNSMIHQDFQQASCPLQCQFCPFKSSSKSKFVSHFMKHHPEHQDLLYLYGLSPNHITDDYKQHDVQEQPRPALPSILSSKKDMTNMWAMMASAAASGKVLAPDRSESHLDHYSANRHRAAPDELEPRENSCSPGTEPNQVSIELNQSMVADLEASIAAEAQHNGECPLDLTKSGSSDNGSTGSPAAGVKRTYSNSDYPELTESEACLDNSSGSPRKRSRKGKAYKLDTLCLDLQEDCDTQTHSNTEKVDDNRSYDEYGSEASGSEGANEDEKFSDPGNGMDTSHESDIVERSHKSSDPEADYAQIRKSLAELNGMCDPNIHNSHSDNSDDQCSEPGDIPEERHLSSPINYTKLIQSTQNMKSHFMKSDESAVKSKPCNGMGNYECHHCDIAFGECVMYTVHMGYHGYKDPFKCNMCGHQSLNKVEFFLHIARVAHQ